MSSSSRKRSDLIERVRYPNPLPLPPYPPKLLHIPTPAERYADPAWSSRLADTVPFPLVVDGEGGMPLDMNAFPELWAVDASGRPLDDRPPPLDPTQIHSEDAWLLDPNLVNAPVPPTVPMFGQSKDGLSAVAATMSTGSASGTATPKMADITAKDVGWLRRTEYLGADKKAKAEAAIRARPLSGSTANVSPEAEAERIETTFKAVDQPLSELRHPTKKDIRPLESFDLFPDFDTWATEMHIFKFSGAPGRHEDSRQVNDPRLPLSLLRSRRDPLTQREEMSFYLPASHFPEVTAEENDGILLADADAFDEEDRDFFADQTGELDDSVREGAIVRREGRRRTRGWTAEVPQEPTEQEVEENEEALAQFARSRAAASTPYQHQRDYDLDQRSGDDDLQRVLILSFSDHKDASSVNGHITSQGADDDTIHPLVQNERIHQKTAASLPRSVFYHLATQRATLRVTRARRKTGASNASDHWSHVALSHRPLTEREELKRLHKRKQVDLLGELDDLQESESEHEEDMEPEAIAEDSADAIDASGEAVDEEGSPVKTSRREVLEDEDEEDKEGRSAATQSQPAAAPSGLPEEKVSKNEANTLSPTAADGDEEDQEDDSEDASGSEEDDDEESIDADEELAALAQEAGDGGVAAEDVEGGRRSRSSRQRTQMSSDRAEGSNKMDLDVEDEMDD